MADVKREDALGDPNHQSDTGTPRPAGTGDTPLFGGGAHVTPGHQPAPPVTDKDGPTAVPPGGAPRPKRP